MPGGATTERAYAMRALYRLTGEERYLHRAAREAPGEPDGWTRLAWAHYGREQWRETFAFALAGIQAAGEPTHATDPNERLKAYDMAATAAWRLDQRPQALQIARQALALCPSEHLAANVAEMERQLEAAA
jgi:hypothetical protein